VEGTHGVEGHDPEEIDTDVIVTAGDVGQFPGTLIVVVAQGDIGPTGEFEQDAVETMVWTIVDPSQVPPQVDPDKVMVLGVHMLEGQLPGLVTVTGGGVVHDWMGPAGVELQTPGIDTVLMLGTHEGQIEPVVIVVVIPGNVVGLQADVPIPPTGDVDEQEKIVVVDASHVVSLSQVEVPP
jgi:hypothetical protein